MRVVFLDIDGVVNTIQIYKELPAHLKNAGLKKIDGYYFDMCFNGSGRVSNTQAVVWLDKICHDYDLKIVVSSTWRGRLEMCKECLYSSGLSRDIEIIGATPWIGGYRGAEIKQYLDAHPEIEDFVILDDDADMEPFMDKLVLTNTYAGITAETELKIAQILEKGLDVNQQHSL